ncbi:conjugal transfer protein TraX [bacterium 210820-DFI.6.52]|nr:conjugal transfer protein TraX [bacterium 210820-DFI.6.52]
MPLPRRAALSGFGLKWLAVCTMLADHIGAAILEPVFLLPLYGLYEGGGGGLPGWYGPLLLTDMALRTVGRLAFPLFCFLLAEGFCHTRDRRRYALQLLTFALLSEIPFDLAFALTPFAPDYQNVYFTLFFGVLSLQLLVWLEGRALLQVLGVGLCCLAAAGLSADYGAMGVLLVALFYLTRQRPAARAAMGSAALLSLGASELPALFSFLPISLYSGQKGRGPKWFFYWFYPLHLLLLWGVGRLFALSLNG